MSRLPNFHILGLRDLFLDEDKTVSPEAGAAVQLEGLDSGGPPNFPMGSTMVVSGPPGAGKTTFALALVRSMLVEDEREKGKAAPKHIVYYISTEVTRSRLKRMFNSRGWFRNTDTLFKQNPTMRKTSGLHVINPPMEIERPVKSSEELVNYIVRQISIQSPPEEDQCVFIIVDSITALFKDSKNAGEARRQVHELTHRLREQFALNPQGSGRPGLGLMILLAEQGIETLENPGMETYVADFVFNLGLKALPMGTRLRTLEVTKSQGANLVIGMHTWLIVSHDSLSRQIVGESLKESLKKEVAATEGVAKDELPPHWGTLLIAPRPRFQPLRSREPSNRYDFSGIRGLDQMLKLDPDFWFENPDAAVQKLRASRSGSAGPVDGTRSADKEGEENQQAAIRAESVTMLVGEAGTGKTSVCYHFIAQHLVSHPASAGLLIGFEQDFKASFETFVAAFPDSKDEDPKRYETIFRPRSGLHINLFLMELREWLKTHAAMPKRVAIDGISNLVATQPKPEFSKILDAIISILVEYPESGEKASLFLTYEVAQSSSILQSDANIFTLLATISNRDNWRSLAQRQRPRYHCHIANHLTRRSTGHDRSSTT